MLIVGGGNGIPVSLTSSIRMAVFPVFTNRIFKPLNCADDGKANAFATYHTADAPLFSLNKSDAVLANVTHEAPFQ